MGGWLTGTPLRTQVEEPALGVLHTRGSRALLHTSSVRGGGEASGLRGDREHRVVCVAMEMGERGVNSSGAEGRHWN